MSAFSFVVPQCEPGVALMVNAPDGVRLKIPLPDTVVPGDELHMGKGPDGAWTITKALRGSGPPRAPPTEWRSAEVMAAECAGAEAITVRFDTTKGPLLFRIVPSWAPIGVQRFLQLVKDGFYDDIGFYRGMQGGLLQFGCIKSTDPRTRYEKLQDDPLVGIPYAEGILSFAAAGPGTRKSTLCIMKADFRSQLGKGCRGLALHGDSDRHGLPRVDGRDAQHNLSRRYPTVRRERCRSRKN